MPLLSICIPTYNRADLLRYCLENLRALDAFGLDYEIVVVDHASTDATPHVLAEAAARWDNVRYFRQAHAVGIERQFTGCLRMGRGTFTTYVADDDKIIPGKLVEYVRYLQAHPEASALYAPWWAYDDAEEKIVHGYFTIEQRTTFNAAEPLVMLDFITAKRIFPESGIYRTDALHQVLVTHENGPYQGFLLPYAMLKCGHVLFERDPYYLEICVTKPQFTAPVRMNVEINLTYLDNLRGALEMMITRMLLDFGTEKLPDHLRSSVHEALLSYAHHRLGFAFHRALALKHYIQASELAHRLMLWCGIFQPDLQQISHDIYAFAGVQAVAKLVSSKTWLERLYIYGFREPDAIIALLRDPETAVAIAAADAATILADPAPEYCFVLVKTDADRAPFLRGALLPGNVVALKNLADYYQIIPAIRVLDEL
jgi:glycosyltransferase involved in cell wall biosynthesis